MKKILPFTTERFLMTPLCEQDRELYCHLYCDEQVMKNISKPLTLEQANKAFDITLKQMQLETPRIITWMITDKATYKRIGIQAISWYTNSKLEPSSLKEQESHPEVGIILEEKSQGKGYATEAMGSLLEYGFSLLSVNTFNIFYRKRNSSTISFLRKLGCSLDLSNQPKDINYQYQYFNKKDWQKSLITKIITTDRDPIK